MNKEMTVRGGQEARFPLAGFLQRKCDCGQHTGGGDCGECKKKKMGLQRYSNGSTGAPDIAPPIVHEVLKSPGQTLDGAARDFMEPRFGHDFSSIRVHSDERAAASARAVNALAYTVGNNIVFANGLYAPQTPAGKHLLAHELTHTVQQEQRGLPAFSRAADNNGPLDDPQLEAEAEEVASKISSEENGEKETSFALMHDAIALNDSEPNHDAARKRSKSVTKHKPKKTKPKPKPNPCSHDILFEGTCQDLVTGAAGRCCDPENGLPNPKRDKDVDGKPCPDHKFTPMFTCDHDCAGALTKGCSDSDNWLALPRKQFTTKRCGELWTICANGKKTQAYVREKSVTQDKFEVGQKVVRDLGVPADTFKGAVYKAGADPKKIDNDRCCSAPPAATPNPAHQTNSTGRVGETAMWV